MLQYVAFGVVVDDIVFEDGRQFLGILGGGGPQAAFGMRLWSEDVGLVATVGEDWPETHRAQLAAVGIDLGGVLTGPWPTLRAWQRYDGRGVRRQDWQVAPSGDRPDWSQCLALAPQEYREAQGYHLGVHPEAAGLDFVRSLQAHGGLVSLELFRPTVRRLDEDAVRALVATPDILSLNLDEAHSLFGTYAPTTALRRLLDAGGHIIALRLGADGALVADARANQAWQIPALPAAVIDPTGAGNAFGGAFLAGYAATGDALTAGLWGSVAASFIVETVGLPLLDAEIHQEAARRLDRPRAIVHLIDL